MLRRQAAADAAPGQSVAAPERSVKEIVGKILSNLEPRTVLPDDQIPDEAHVSTKTFVERGIRIYQAWMVAHDVGPVTMPPDEDLFCNQLIMSLIRSTLGEFGPVSQGSVRATRLRLVSSPCRTSG